jgi:hypothetical protein
LSINASGGGPNGDHRLLPDVHRAKGEGLQWGVTTVETRESFAAEAQSPLASVELNPGQTRITGAYSGPQPATAQSGLSFTGHVDALIDGQSGSTTSSVYYSR